MPEASIVPFPSEVFMTKMDEDSSDLPALPGPNDISQETTVKKPKYLCIALNIERHLDNRFIQHQIKQTPAYLYSQH